ncbi:MAG: CocE/NonD family hydrolase [Longimicrobiales bacterium]
MRESRIALLTVLIAGLNGNGLSAQREQITPNGPYDVVLFEENKMMTMRDGVRMATDIYRPARNGVVVADRLPILLSRTPYDKSGLATRARWFASHGYVVVTQDTRGRYKSEGVFAKYYDYDAYDGFDTIEQIAKLPFTTGEVGMWGTSYGAHTQADPAKLNPRGMKTLVVNMGGTANGWTNKVRQGGALELGQQLGWAFSQLAADSDDPVVKELLEAETVEKWFAALPFRKGLNPLSIAPNFEDYVLDMFTQGDYKHWKGLGENWVEYYDQTADVPMLHISGWYDSYTGGTVENYLGLSKRKTSPMRLILGPWTHGGNTRSFAGDVEFGPSAAITDFAGEFHLRWFDHYLKAKKTGVEAMPAIRVFVMGTGDGHKDANGRLFHGGYWRDETEWPLTGTKLTEYYFQPGGGLRTQVPEAGEGSTTFHYDPRNPVPTIGGSFSGALRSGAFDQREREGFYGSKPPYMPLKSRRDVLVFQTEPLEEDVEVVGPIKVRLFAASNALDTDFTVKLVDVYPPTAAFPTGFDMNLTDGILRARYRNSPDRQELMTPGSVYEFVVDPFPTGNVFKKGHRIRIDISSSNFPRFDVNPNTGEPLGMDRGLMVATNVVHHSARYPSHVVLPIVPTKRTRPATDDDGRE